MFQWSDEQRIVLLVVDVVEPGRRGRLVVVFRV
jgi:hypothetical protein